MPQRSQTQFPEPEQHQRTSPIDQLIQSLERRLHESAAELQKICELASNPPNF
jgi:hypothetical protein